MKIILRYLGFVLLISSIFRIIPLTAALIYDEPYSSFLLSAFLSIVLGLIFLGIEKKLTPKTQFEFLSVNQAFIFVGLSFILIALTGSISFLPSFNYNFVDALFESTSGITTTGLTAYSSIADLPKSLLLWRAELQWMGGLGIVLFLLFLLFKKEAKPRDLGYAEESGQIRATLSLAHGINSALKKGVKISTGIKIYLFYTLLGILLLFLAGMPFYDSIAMSFTSISTGGFVVSEQFYTNNIQLFILSLMMLTGATSFIVHQKLFSKEIKEFILQSERNIMLLFTSLAVVAAFFTFPDIKIALFETISAYTTTGYSLTTIALLPQLFIFIIMLGMIIGGSTISTAGGMKVFRFYTVLKIPFWYLKKLASPLNALIPFKFDKKPVPEKTLLSIQVFFSLWLMLLTIGTLVLMVLGNNFLDSSFQMTSALGTVGLSTMNLSTLHWIGKTVLMLGMLLGRVEMYPIMLMIRHMFKVFRKY